MTASLDHYIPLSASSLFSSLLEKKVETPSDDDDMGNSSCVSNEDHDAPTSEQIHGHESNDNDDNENSTLLVADKYGDRPKSCVSASRSMIPCIGGPGTVLPRFVEALMAWGLAFSCLSVACWYYYVGGAVVMPGHNKIGKRSFVKDDPLVAMPLMTHCPRELLTVSTLEGLLRRYQQLQGWISMHLPQFSMNDDDRNTNNNMAQVRNVLLQFVRTNEVARRLVSLIMVQRHRRPSLWLTFIEQVDDSQESPADPTNTTTLMGALEQIWPQLVSLPPTEQVDDKCPFDISVVVPLYKENGRDFLVRMHSWIKSADDPNRIEFIIVNAGECTQMDEIESILPRRPGDNNGKHHMVSILEFDNGGGRGPCLNFGARHATGRLLTFVHADTRLSPHWDTAVRHALQHTNSPDTDNENASSVTTLCAFSFAIDRSLGSTNVNDQVAASNALPPGLSAIETTANWRCRLFKLPYGDQCLSVPRYIFEYVGGYPDQCLMEDYELVRFLRQRSRISEQAAARLHTQERMHMLQQPAHCSPRRWQALGVIYVTAINSWIVQLYNTAISNDSARGHDEGSGGGGKLCKWLTPDEELFCRYYGTAVPLARMHPYHSPWELQLQTK
jgi:hypothetical protein